MDVEFHSGISSVFNQGEKKNDFKNSDLNEVFFQMQINDETETRILVISKPWRGEDALSVTKTLTL